MNFPRDSLLAIYLTTGRAKVARPIFLHSCQSSHFFGGEMPVVDRGLSIRPILPEGAEATPARWATAVSVDGQRAAALNSDARGGTAASDTPT